MAYTPTDWVDDVTPVDEARMDHIEQGIVDAHARLTPSPVVNGQWIKGVGGAAVWAEITQAEVTGLPAALTAKQATSEKGQVSGYASLDANGKVPAAQLPPGSVLSSYSNALPANPVDGQEAILADSVTAPTYQWRFRWNASNASAYKWEYIGGAPLSAGPVGSLSGFTTTSWTRFTAGPSILVPRNGEYLVEFGLFTQAHAGGAYNITAAIGEAGVGAPGPSISFVPDGTGPFAGANISGMMKATFGAGKTYSFYVQVSAAITTSFEFGWIKLTPVRVA
jgi:hypothetical protein